MKNWSKHWKHILLGNVSIIITKVWVRGLKLHRHHLQYIWSNTWNKLKKFVRGSIVTVIITRKTKIEFCHIISRISILSADTLIISVDLPISSASSSSWRISYCCGKSSIILRFPELMNSLILSSCGSCLLSGTSSG